MWIYEKKLQYPVKIARPNATLAKLITTQYGGPDGELGASLRYLSQRFAMPMPELKAISLFHHGAYEGIPASRQRLVDYAMENNIKLSGVFRNLYLEGPPQHKDSSKFITQIIAIIE